MTLFFHLISKTGLCKIKVTSCLGMFAHHLVSFQVYKIPFFIWLIIFIGNYYE